MLFAWLESKSLSTRAREIMQAMDNELLYSQVSLWEISLKYSIGKLPLPEEPRVYLPACIRRMSLGRAPLSDEVVYRSTELAQHHRDPFDRILIATAQKMSLPIISSDRVFSDYEVEVIW